MQVQFKRHEFSEPKTVHPRFTRRRSVPSTLIIASYKLQGISNRGPLSPENTFKIGLVAAKVLPRWMKLCRNSYGNFSDNTAWWYVKAFVSAENEQQKCKLNECILWRPRIPYATQFIIGRDWSKFVSAALALFCLSSGARMLKTTVNTAAGSSTRPWTSWKISANDLELCLYGYFASKESVQENYAPEGKSC